MKETRCFFVVLLLLLIVMLVFWSISREKSQTIKFKETVLEQGEYFFDEDLLVEKDEILIIMPGAILNFGENKKILVYGKIIAEGTEENPIIFQSEGDVFWRGVKIEGTQDVPSYEKYWNWLKNGDSEVEKSFLEKIEQGNRFKYCNFLNISNEENKLTEESRWIGAIEVYNSSILVSDSLFDDINYLGGVVIQKSYSVIKGNDFVSDEIHKQINTTKNSVSLIYENRISANRETKQGCADGIWTVDSVALIYLNDIKGLADDAINTGKSYSIIGFNNISEVSDDGIDIETGSLIGESIVFNNSIKNVKNYGIKLTEASAVLVDNYIQDSDAGLGLRNGSIGLVSNTITENNEKGLVIFNSIPCVLEEQDFLKVKEDILKVSDDVVCSKICPGNICLPDSNFLTGLELIEALESSYSKKNGYYFYNKNYLDRTIREIFQRRTDILQLNPIIKNEVKDESIPCFEYKNMLFLENSDFKNNKIEKLFFNNFDLSVNEKLADYECQTQDDYLCEFRNRDSMDVLINRLEEILRNDF